jgi:DNA repair photolyase
MQPSLFDPKSQDSSASSEKEATAEGGLPEKPTSLGKSEVAYREARSIVTKGKGFLEEYDYSLNPYEGCFFGCTYCYAAFFARSKKEKRTWGEWVKVKENALSLLERKRTSTLQGKTVYMSSVTDPYQPIERKLRLSRGILRLLAERFQPALVVQTRSPDVTRDIDLLKRLERVQVNVTVTTDSDEVRQAFEPTCPKNAKRLDAVRELSDAGVPTCITMTPLLPVENGRRFARNLKATGADRFIVQPFHAGQGRFVAGTREQAEEMIEKYDWGKARYAEVLAEIKKEIPGIGEGKEGFAPVW